MPLGDDRNVYPVVNRRAGDDRGFHQHFRHSKKLEQDINEFERFEDDNPKRRLTYLTDALERIIPRDRTIENRKAQVAAHTKYGSASGDLGSSGGTAAPAKGKGGGRGKGKGKDNDKNNDGGKNGGVADTGGAPVPKALEGLKFCRAFAHGNCPLPAEECKKQRGFCHLSRPQLVKMFGFDPFQGPEPGG